MSKKYYWLKLNDNFFEDDTIVWIEEQENGKDYVIFYLKLLLKSLKEEGSLIRYVGEMVIPYDNKALAKLTNTKIDTVTVAMKAFIDVGLIREMDTGELYLTQINEMIGTETDSARRVRKHRALSNIGNKPLKALHCNTDVTKCNTEIEIEKEIEIELDKEKEYKTYGQIEHFNEFWEAYPNKKNKKKAKDKYLKSVDKELHQTIMKDLKTRKKSKDWTKDNGKYIPHPTTYLNGERWNDQIEANASTSRYDLPTL